MTAAPKLLQNLREQLPLLPEAQQAVVRYLLENPQDSARQTVEQIAKNAAVSMPTVVRTCRSFGYDNVRKFMLDLVQDLAISGSFLHRSVELSDSIQQVIDKIAAASAASLAAIGQSLEAKTIDLVVERLAAAKRIDCFSVGAASRFMTEELQSRLFRLGLTANAIFDAHQQLISASTLGANGVAFVISHVGRMPYTLEAAQFARTHGATVIAMTEANTPLAKIADIVIEISVPPDAVMKVGTEAYLAHLLVIEILMVRLAQRLDPQVTHGLQQFRKLLEKHGFDSHDYQGFAHRG